MQDPITIYPKSICSDNCYGVNNNHGGCCTIDNRNYAIGPHSDTEEFVQRLRIKFNRNIQYSDVFMDFEEGSKLYPDNPSYQTKRLYPILRVVNEHPRKPCIFYNVNIRRCTVNDIKPHTCKIYKCEYLLQNE